MRRLLTITALIASFILGTVATVSTTADGVTPNDPPMLQYETELGQQLITCSPRPVDHDHLCYLTDPTTATRLAIYYRSLEGNYSLIEAPILDATKAETEFARQVISCDPYYQTQTCFVKDPITDRILITFSTNDMGAFENIAFSDNATGACDYNRFP